MTAHPRLALVAVLLLAAGCAAGRAARAGEDALGRGDFEAAVRFYEEAVREAPDDAEYQAGLARVKARAAEDAVAKGDQARLGGDLNAAASRYQRAQQLNPRPEWTERLASVEQERAAAEAVLAKAQSDAASGRLQEALAALRTIERYRPTFSQFDPTLDQVSRTLCDQALATGQAAFNRGALESAQATLREALGYRPGDPAALALLARVEARMRSQAACQQGAEALKQGQFRAALEAYSRAAAEDASDPMAQAGVERSRLSLADSLKREAAVEAKANRDGRALSLLREAMGLLNAGAARSDLEGLASATAERLASRLEGRGDAALRARLPGAAWAYFRAAAKVRGAERRAPPDLAPLLSYRVELSASGGPLAADSLQILAGQIARALPPEVQLVGQGTGSDAQLRLAAAAPRFDHDIERVERRSVEYVERIDSVRNPRHDDLRREVRHLSDRLRDLEARLDGHAEAARVRRQAVERAERELAQARERAAAEARRQAEQLQRQAGAESTRAAHLAVEISRLERELSSQQQIGRQGQGGRRQPPQERALPQTDPLERRLAALRKEQAEANAHAQELLQKARTLTENPPATDEQRRASAEVDRARRDENDFQNRVYGPLKSERDRVAHDLHRTRQDLANTPERMRQPVHATFTWGVEHHVLSAGVAGVVSVYDSLAGAERLRLEATAQRVARDTAFPAAHLRGEPDLYVEADPLDLPSERWLAQSLAEDLAAKFADPVARVLQGHRGRFLEAARRQAGDGRLHFWILAAQTGVALEPAALEEARSAIYQGCALDIANDTVDLNQADRL